MRKRKLITDVLVEYIKRKQTSEESFSFMNLLLKQKVQCHVGSYYGDFRRMIDYALTWSTTPQGRGFWYMLNSRRDEIEAAEFLINSEDVCPENLNIFYTAYNFIANFDFCRDSASRIQLVRDAINQPEVILRDFTDGSFWEFANHNVMLASFAPRYQNAISSLATAFNMLEHFGINNPITNPNPFTAMKAEENVELVMLSDGKRQGESVPAEEVVYLSEAMYITSNGGTPCCHVSDETVTLCDDSEYAGQIALMEHAIQTESGFVADDERVVNDVTENYDLPIPYRAKQRYNLVPLNGRYSGGYGYQDSDVLKYGVVNSSGGQGYFMDSEDYVFSEYRDEYYISASIAEDNGLEYDGDDWCPPRRWVASYGELDTVYKTSGSTTISFGVEVEKEDNYVKEENTFDYVLKETGWGKEHDGSLNEGGFEAISPVYDLVDLTAFNKDMENSIVRNLVNADYEDSCGGHFNVSMVGVSSRELLQALRGFLPLIYALYPERMRNSYCEAKSLTMLTESPTKYSSAYTKNDKILEIRIFDAVRNVADLKWRVRLMQLALTKYYGASEIEVLRLIANRKSTLSAHLRSYYRTVEGRNGEKGMQRFMLKTAMNFIENSRKYNFVVLQLPKSMATAQ
jgi:hypothetical protein